MVIQNTIHANRSAEHNINEVFKGSEKGKESEERCRRLTTDQVIEVCGRILVRNGGTKKRLIGALRCNGGKGGVRFARLFVCLFVCLFIQMK